MADYDLGTARGKIEIDSSGAKKGTADAEKAVAGFSVGLGEVGKQFTSKVLPIAAGFAALSLTVSKSWHGAQKDMQITTGATGSELDKLMKGVQNVTGTVKGSVGEISSTMADLAVKTKLTGEPLETLTKRLFGLKEIGKDVAVGEVAAAFGKWKVPTDQWADSLDRLFKISQKTGTTIPTLLGRLAEFQPILQPLGYSMDQVSLIVAKLSDEALPGLKKALLDITKNHAESAKAGLENEVAQKKYDAAVKAHGATSLGARVAADKLKETQKAVADSTGTARESFDKLIASVRTAKTDQEALVIATEAFGTRAAPALSQAIRSGKFDVEALSKAVDENKNSIEKTAEAHRTFIDRLGMLKEKAVALVGPFANTAATAATIVGGIGPLAQGISKIKEVVSGVTKASEALKKGAEVATAVGTAADATRALAGGMTAITAASAAGPAVGVLGAAAGAEGAAAGAAAVPTAGLGAAIWTILWPVLLVIAAVGLIVGAFLLLTRVFGIDTKDAIVILMAVLLPFIGIPLLIIREWDKIAGFFNRIWDAVWGFFAGFLGNIGGWIGNVGKKLGEFIGLFTGLPGKVWEAIGDFVGRMREMGGNIVQGLIDGIKNLAGRVADTIRDVITAPLKGVGKILGISSPSKLFENYGRMIDAGLMKGLDQIEMHVRPVLTSAVSPPIASIPSSVTNSSMTSAPSVTIDATFEFGVGSSADDIRRAWNDDIKSELADTLESVLTGVISGTGSR